MIADLYIIIGAVGICFCFFSIYKLFENQIKFNKLIHQRITDLENRREEK